MYLTNKEKKARFFKLMGCVTLIVSIAMVVGIIVDIVNGFKNHASWWPITANYLNLLAVITLGTGFTVLFFEVGKHEKTCNCRL